MQTIRLLAVKRFFIWAILIGSLACGAISSIQMFDIYRNSEAIATNWMPSVKAASEMQIIANHIRRVELEIFLTQEQSIQKTKYAELQKLVKNMDDTEIAYVQLINSDEEKSLYKDFHALRDVYLTNQNRILKQIYNKQSADSDLFTLSASSQNDIYAAMMKKLEDITDFNNQGASQAFYASKQSLEEAKKLLIAVFFFTALVLTGMAI